MSRDLNFPDTVPELFGEQVRLRELSEADIPAWFARATDTLAAPLAGDSIPDSIDAGTAWLQRHRDRFRERSALRWSIDLTGSARGVGTVGLALTSGEPRVGRLSIVIGRSHWGKGIGTSAARVAADYAFAKLGLTEIDAEVLQCNVRSVRLLEKLGFRLLRTIPAEESADADACFIYVLRAPHRSAA